MPGLDDEFERIKHSIIGRLKKKQGLEDEDLLVLGLTSRAFSLYKGMGAALDNPHVFVVLYRSQIETLATINHLNRHPEEAERFLHGGRKSGKYRISNILTLIDSCSRRYDGLREIYDEISDMAHPNSASHFLSIDRSGDSIRWRSRPAFSEEEQEKVGRGHEEINSHIVAELDLLIGKLMG